MPWEEGPRDSSESAGGPLVSQLARDLQEDGGWTPPAFGLWDPGPVPPSALSGRKTSIYHWQIKKMHPRLFVIAAVQRKANFRKRLLKNISTLNSMINQALKMQIHPAFWAFLATQGSSGLRSGLARPPSHWGHPGFACPDLCFQPPRLQGG